MNSSQWAMRQRLLDLLDRGARARVADVLENRPVEQEVLLQHRRQLLAVFAEPDRREIAAVDQDAALASDD